MLYYLLQSDGFAEFLALFGAVVLVLLGISLHEFSHALSASALGDQTARRLGRVSLNPAVHLDPFGTVLLLIAGFGWGKPTPVNPMALRNGRMGMATVAACGPISNLVIAAALAAPIRFGVVEWHAPFSSTLGWTSGDYVGLFLSFSILLNVILALFNLLPIAPLDGFKVAVGILPIDLARSFVKTEQYGMPILMILLFMPYLIGVSPFQEILLPAVDRIVGILTGVQ